MRQFFARRQPSNGGPTLSIKEVIKVENPRSLRAFARGAAFDIRPLRAHHAGDTLLFHGCPQESAPNIQAEGLLLGFASSGMLGQGLCTLLLIQMRCAGPADQLYVSSPSPSSQMVHPTRGNRFSTAGRSRSSCLSAGSTCRTHSMQDQIRSIRIVSSTSSAFTTKGMSWSFGCSSLPNRLAQCIHHSLLKAAPAPRQKCVANSELFLVVTLYNVLALVLSDHASSEPNSNTVWNVETRLASPKCAFYHWFVWPRGILPGSRSCPRSRYCHATATAHAGHCPRWVTSAVRCRAAARHSPGSRYCPRHASHAAITPRDDLLLPESGENRTRVSRR